MAEQSDEYVKTKKDIDIIELHDISDEKQAEPLEDTIFLPTKRQSLSWRWPILLILACCLLYYLVHLNDHVLPNVVSEEEAIENPALFSGIRSQKSLRRLCAIGPRVAGHESNEKFAPELIEEEVKNAIRSAHPSQNILIQRQIGSGAYELKHKIPFTNIYLNVQNVLVLFEGNEGKHSILVNCHYDTVPEVEGASDDGISCAVMLELVRVLAANNKRLQHNVVFLFNGAEEASLQGSHLFMQHEWKKKCKIVLNLEASGIGGRSILFQSGPQNPWILKYYARYAPHPHAQVLAEEMFQSGMIPSDTDFRIFRDFGNMPGLDFAFSRNAHVYHTKYDSERYILAGSHQHMGDNTLALIRSIGNAPELDNIEAYSKGQMVFYDYLGWFLFIYSAGGAIALNIFTVIFAIFSIVIYVGRVLKWSWIPDSTGINGKNFEKITFTNLAKKFKPNSKDSYSTQQNEIQQNGIQQNGIQQNISREENERSRNEYTNNCKAFLVEILISMCGRIIAMGAAIAVTTIMGVIINSAATLAMPWYTNVWLIFPLYWCPCLVVYALIPHYIDIWRSKKHNLSLTMTAQMNLIAIQIPFIFILFLMTCMGIRSAALFFLPVLCSAIANLVLYLTPLYKSAYSWIWAYLGIQIPAILMNMYYTLLAYIIFTPVMARSGVTSGDLFIAVLSALLCIFVSSFAMPLMTLVRKPGIVFTIVSLFSIVMIILSLNTEIGFPYSAGPINPRPQRYWIMHTAREFRNQSGHIRRSDTGYFILNMDINSPRTIPMTRRTLLRSLSNDCESEYYCGLPLWMTRMVPLSPGSSWIPATPPVFPTDTALKVISKDCNQVLMQCTYRFNITGPNRITITFVPQKGATLIKWSVPTEPTISEIRNNLAQYFLHLVRARIDGDYELSLTFKVDSDQMKGSPVFEIGVAGNHVHHQEYRTEAFQTFLDSFPDWTDKFGWISAYKSYLY